MGISAPPAKVPTDFSAADHHNLRYTVVLATPFQAS